MCCRFSLSSRYGVKRRDFDGMLQGIIAPLALCAPPGSNDVVPTHLNRILVINGLLCSGKNDNRALFQCGNSETYVVELGMDQILPKHQILP